MFSVRPHSGHRALEKTRSADIRRLQSERRSPSKINPLRSKSGTNDDNNRGVKGVSQAHPSAATATTPIQRHPTRQRCPSDSGASSASQPRPHSDFIPGVNDDRYVAAWRKRGPVTLLNVAAAATATTADLSATESRSSDDDGGSGGLGGALPRRSTSKLPNPKLQQTIQEVLSESSNDSTDEFLGNEADRQSKITSSPSFHSPLEGDKKYHPPPHSTSQTHSPGHVKVVVRRSDHLSLDESGESETDNHTHPELSV